MKCKDNINMDQKGTECEVVRDVQDLSCTKIEELKK
jgi:hypothetical protein